jgi:outer membrane protein TolC
MVRPSFLHSDLIAASSFSPERLGELGLTASLERKFWETGGQLSLSFASTMIDQDLPTLSLPGDGSELSTGVERFHEHALTVNYSQPLLRNYRGRLDQLEYSLADYTVDITELQAVENQERFLFDIGNKYLDWVLYEEQLKIAEERLALADRQLEQSTAKYEANLIDKVDVLRSEDAVRKARQNMVLIKSRIAAQKAELAVLTRNNSIVEMKPDYDLYGLSDFGNTEDVYDKALERSRIINAMKVRQNQLEKSREGFKETGKPMLDLNLGIGLKGGDERFGESIALDKPDLTASLLFIKPLGNTAARSDIARTDLQLEQLQYEIEKIALNLESAITSLMIQLTELEKVLELNQSEIESARERTVEEIELYNQGRSDLSFVIQSQDNEQNARLLYAENAATYQKIVLTCLELMDQIMLTDGGE